MGGLGLLIRRRAIQSFPTEGVKDGTYEEIIVGYKLGFDGEPVRASSCCIVSRMPTNGATLIEWGTQGAKQEYLCEYKDETFADYWGPVSNPRQVTIKSSSNYVSASFLYEYLENSYVLDVKRNIFLYKGKNVVL